MGQNKYTKLSYLRERLFGIRSYFQRNPITKYLLSTFFMPGTVIG